MIRFVYKFLLLHGSKRHLAERTITWVETHFLGSPLLPHPLRVSALGRRAEAAAAKIAHGLRQQPTSYVANGPFTCPDRLPHNRRPIMAPSTVTKGGKLNLHRQGKAPSILPRVRLPILSGCAAGAVPVSIRDN